MFVSLLGGYKSGDLRGVVMSIVIPFKKNTDRFFLKRVVVCGDSAFVDIADINKGNCTVTSLTFERCQQFGWCISNFANSTIFTSSNVLANLVQRALLIISKGEQHGF